MTYNFRNTLERNILKFNEKRRESHGFLVKFSSTRLRLIISFACSQMTPKILDYSILFCLRNDNNMCNKIPLHYLQLRLTYVIHFSAAIVDINRRARNNPAWHN